MAAMNLTSGILLNGLLLRERFSAIRTNIVKLNKMFKFHGCGTMVKMVNIFFPGS